MSLKHMREKELLELLSQCESEERFGLPAASKQWSDVSFCCTRVFKHTAHLLAISHHSAFHGVI